MSTAARFPLKRASGWFAAGPEVEIALRLLSDAAFKLFVWFCLHADRSCGSIAAAPSELALALRRSEAEMQATLEELCRQDVCAAAGWDDRDHRSFLAVPTHPGSRRG